MAELDYGDVAGWHAHGVRANLILLIHEGHHVALGYPWVAVGEGVCGLGGLGVVIDHVPLRADVAVATVECLGKVGADGFAIVEIIAPEQFLAVAAAERRACEDERAVGAAVILLKAEDHGDVVGSDGVNGDGHAVAVWIHRTAFIGSTLFGLLIVEPLEALADEFVYVVDYWAFVLETCVYPCHDAILDNALDVGHFYHGLAVGILIVRTPLGGWNGAGAVL